MSDAPERLDLQSLDIAEEKRQELIDLFPEARTEDGKIDFERLKLALGETDDVGRERYGMTWPGKADCFKTIQAPSLATLRPCPEESANFDTTENLIIEGDNLEVLKLLQKSYLGKVKMIYIDPPYNTGNDFIYPDNFSETLQTYLEYTGQADAEGRRFGTNTDADGRFHSKWLNMMYPRLYLARNLLRDDGAIFISIDDNEVENLRRLCDEIFGEENFVATVVWEKKYAPQNDAKYLSDTHDFILLYARNKMTWRPNLLPRSDEATARYRNPDNDPRGPWKPSDLLRMEHRDNSVYTITSPSGKSWTPEPGTSWRHPEDEMNALRASNDIWFGPDGNAKPARKRFLTAVREGVVAKTIWPHAEVGHTQEGTQVFKSLFAASGVEFVGPKPPRLIRRMLELATAGLGDTVLDFFAGSGSTAQAVLDQNREDGGTRRFISVQLPEPTDRDDYATIAEITKERVRRAIAKLNEADAGRLPEGDPQDRGFRVFKLAESSFTPWNAAVPEDLGALVSQLELHIDHTREGRSQADLLAELLLKSGFPLTAGVELLSVEGKSVYSVAGGALLVCLEQGLNLDLIRAMAKLQPERVLCLDEGFAGNDQLKTNAVLTFRDAGVAAFKTV